MLKKFKIQNSKFKILFILSFLILQFTLVTSSVMAQTPCNQVPLSSWRGVTTYDVCDSESCNNGTWTTSCHSSVNPNCQGTYTDGACGSTSTSTSTTTTTAPDCSVTLNGKSLGYRNVDSNSVIILSPDKSILNSTSSSVYYTAQASSNCSIQYMFNLYYWNPDSQKWVKNSETSWQSPNYVTLSMDSGIRQYSAGFGVSACNSKGCDTKWDWIQFWYMQIDPTRPIQVTSEGVLSGNIIAPDYIPIFGEKIPNASGYYNPKYYILVSEDPAVRANQSPDSKEVEIPSKYIGWSNETGAPTYKITFSINDYPLPNLQSGKTYYFRLRQHGTGTDLYIPGPSTGVTSTRVDSSPPVITANITPSDPKATDDISIIPLIQDDSTIIESSIYLDGDLKYGCSTSPSSVGGCNSGGITGIRLNAGVHTYKITASDKYNNATTKEGNITVKSSFSVSHSPTQPDSSSNVSYSASGIGVSNIKIFVDGSQVKNCDGLSCLLTGGPYTGSSTHTYYATATDALGNTIQDPPVGTKNFTVSATPVAVNPRITNNDFGEASPRVTCIGENFCMAVWNRTVPSGGNDWPVATIYYSVWNGSSWSAPGVIYSSPNYGGGALVSCLSANSCLAVWSTEEPANGYQRIYYASWNGSSWSSDSAITPANTMDLLPSLSCAGNNCMVVWRRYTGAITEDWKVLNSETSENTIYYARWNGNSLSAPTAIASNVVLSGGGAWGLSGNRQSISCTSDNFCMLLWGRSNPGIFSYIPKVSLWNGSSWSTTEVSTGNVGSDVSCSSNTYCMSVSGGGTSSWNGSVWAGLGSGGTYANVSCYSNICLMSPGGSAYTIYKQNSIFQSGFFAYSSYRAGLSCPSANMCMALNSSGSGTSSEIYFEKISTVLAPSPSPLSSPSLAPSPSPSPVPAHPAGAANLLSNGDFENQLNSWVCGGAVSGTCIADSAVKYAGSYSAKVANTGPGQTSSSDWGWQLSQGNFTAAANEDFCLSARVKKQNANDWAFIAIQETDSPWRQLTIWPENNTDWQQVIGTLRRPASWNTPTIQVYLRQSYTASVWFDDVILTRGACVLTASPSASSSPSPVASGSPLASVTPSPSPVSSSAPVSSGTPTTPCTLSSASWGTTVTNPVVEGTSLTLNVSSNGDCSGKQVEFKIKEDDGIFGSQDVRVNPSPVSFSGNSASTTWVSEYQCDGFLCLNDPPEYYFEAKIVGDNTTFHSSDPEIQVNKAASLIGPNTINGFVYIDANQNGVKDSTEKCYAGEVKVSISMPGKAPITYNQDVDCTVGYKFENLPNGTYTITINPISGVESTNTTPWQQSVTVP